MVSPKHVEDHVLQAAELADLRRVDVAHGHDREEDDQPAEDERGDHRAQDRERCRAARLLGLLAQRAGGVEAVHHVGGGQRGGQEGAEVAPVVALAGALRLEQHVRAARDVGRQQDDQQHCGDQLDEHAAAVDAGHQLHAQGVDHRGEDDQHGAQDHRVRGEVVLAGAVAVDLEARPDLGKRELVGQRHGGDRHDRGGEHHPAAEPGHRGGAQLLRPVVDRAGHREVRGQLGEAERHHQLADEDHRPGPPVGRAAEGEAEVEELEDAGEDRDVADAGREAGELPDAAVQLLLVAEIGEFVRMVAARRRGHLPSPGSGTRRISQRAAGPVNARHRRVPGSPPAVRHARRAGARERGGQHGDRVPRRAGADPRQRRGHVRVRLRGAARRGRAAGGRPPAGRAGRGRDVRLRLAAHATTRSASWLVPRRTRSSTASPPPRSARCSSGPPRCRSWRARWTRACACWPATASGPSPPPGGARYAS